jgi:hypothetical protein
MKAKPYLTTQKYNGTKSKWEDFKVKIDKAKSDQSSRAAIFRRQMDADDDHKLLYEEIEVYSPELRKLLDSASPTWREAGSDSDRFVLHLSKVSYGVGTITMQLANQWTAIPMQKLRREPT